MNSNQNSLSNDFNADQIWKDCRKGINSIIDSMPFFVKIILFSTILFFIIGLFTQLISFYLVDIPYFTILHFQIWRLITTPFITTGLLSIIFSLLFWYRDAVKQEQEKGTIKYILHFFMLSFFIQILYCSIMLILSIIIQNSIVLRIKMTMGGIRNEGLWPILMCDLTLLCLSNPEQDMKFFFFPCNIKAKYYPLVLFFIFTVLSGFNVDLEIFCGIAFGFLYKYYLNDRLEISNSFVLIIENSCFCHWIVSKKGFISINNIGDNDIPANIENVANTNNPNSNTFSAFQGKGVAVGSSNENISRENVDYANLSTKTNEDTNSGETSLEMNNSESQV